MGIHISGSKAGPVADHLDRHRLLDVREATGDLDAGEGLDVPRVRKLERVAREVTKARRNISHAGQKVGCVDKVVRVNLRVCARSEALGGVDAGAAENVVGGERGEEVEIVRVHGRVLLEDEGSGVLEDALNEASEDGRGESDVELSAENGIGNVEHNVN